MATNTELERQRDKALNFCKNYGSEKTTIGDESDRIKNIEIIFTPKKCGKTERSKELTKAEKDKLAFAITKNYEFPHQKSMWHLPEGKIALNEAAKKIAHHIDKSLIDEMQSPTYKKLTDWKDPIGKCDGRVKLNKHLNIGMEGNLLGDSNLLGEGKMIADKQNTHRECPHCGTVFMLYGREMYDLLREIIDHTYHCKSNRLVTWHESALNRIDVLDRTLKEQYEINSKLEAELSKLRKKIEPKDVNKKRKR